MKKYFYRDGFTMIELLVTISIIGILSALIYANFNEARDEARNNAIKVELKEIKLALEVYKSQNGKYPLPADLSRDLCRGDTFLEDRKDQTILFSFSADGPAGCGDVPVITGLVPEYLSESLILTNPGKRSGNPNCYIAYLVNDDQSSYKLMATNCLAGADDSTEGVQPQDEFSFCPPGCDDVSTAVPDYKGTMCVPSFPPQFAEPINPFFYETFSVYSEGGRCY